MSGIIDAIKGITGLGLLFGSFFTGLGAVGSLLSLVSLMMKPNPFGQLNEEMGNMAALTFFLLIITYMGVKFAGLLVKEE